MLQVSSIPDRLSRLALCSEPKGWSQGIDVQLASRMLVPPAFESLTISPKQT